jgi:hypothetical protein
MKRNFVFIFFIFSIFFLNSIDSKSIDWINGKIYSSVTVSVKSDHNFAHNRIKEIENAREKAKINFYSILKKINIDDSTMLLDSIEESEEKRNNLFNMIDNAQIQKMEYPNLNLIKVTYFINIFGENSLLNIIMYDADNFQEELPRYSDYVIENQYTGIIIDARNELTTFDDFKTFIKPSIFIKIKDNNGKTIFSRYNVNPEILKNKGMVRYSYDINENLTERVGDNPFKIVAFGSGDKKGSTIVITETDAKKILSSSKTRKSLQSGNVVVIINP